MNGLLLTMYLLFMPINPIETKEICVFRCTYVQVNDQLWRPVEHVDENIKDKPTKIIYFTVERKNLHSICIMRYSTKIDIKIWKEHNCPIRKWIQI